MIKTASSSLSRDSSLDSLRGMAVVLMIMANLTPTLSETPPLFLRFLGTLAAPFFTLLSGYMMGLNQSKRGRTSLKKTSKRVSMLFFWGAMIDFFAYDVVPFFPFDVLYLIGVGSFLLFFLQQKSHFFITALILVILLLSSFLQFTLPYSPIPAEYSPITLLSEFQLTQAIQSIFYDGWFPLFPWLAMPLIGYLLGREGPFSKKTSLMGFILGGILWFFSPLKSVPREGYTELFYPFSFGAILFMVSFFQLSLRFLQTKQFHLPFFSLFGKYCLSVYVLHLFIISTFKEIYPNKLELTEYFILYALLTFALFSFILLRRKIVHGTNQLRRFRFLFGE